MPGRLMTRAEVRLLTPAAAGLFAGSVFAGCVHEYGHCLAIVLAGGRVGRVQPVWLLGRLEVSFSGNLTRAARLWLDVSGVAAAFLFGTLLAILALRLRSLTARTAVTAFAVPAAFQPLAWVLFPSANALLGYWAGEDSLHFVVRSGLHPLVVAAGAALIFAMGVRLWIAGGGRELVRQLLELARAPRDGAATPR